MNSQCAIADWVNADCIDTCSSDVNVSATDNVVASDAKT